MSECHNDAVIYVFIKSLFVFNEILAIILLPCSIFILYVRFCNNCNVHQGTPPDVGQTNPPILLTKVNMNIKVL